MKEFAFPSRQRLKSQKAIDRLFGNRDYRGPKAEIKGTLCYPLRIVAADSLTSNEGKPGPRILISVPKKKVRKAVKRVLVRRRIREAWRLNTERKQLGNLDIAFIYVADSPVSFDRIRSSMEKLISKLIGD